MEMLVVITMDDGALGIEHLKNGRCSALGIEHSNKTINILSNSVNGNIRTVIVERSLIGISEDYYSFIPNQMGTIPLITAIGQSQTFAYHKAHAYYCLILLVCVFSVSILANNRTTESSQWYCC